MRAGGGLIPEKRLIFPGAYAGISFEYLGKVIGIVESRFFGNLPNPGVGIPKQILCLFYSDPGNIIGKGGIHLFPEQVGKIKFADKDRIRNAGKGKVFRIVVHNVLYGLGKMKACLFILTVLVYRVDKFPHGPGGKKTEPFKISIFIADFKGFPGNPVYLPQGSPGVYRGPGEERDKFKKPYPNGIQISAGKTKNDL
jgi:hypothetical protein